jgi:glycosyltransferase involved in cell wall biosynthesis
MISIIIPLYNQAKEIKKCLESIKAQSFDNYEIIVVNDRSQDRLSKVIDWSKKIFSYRIEWHHNTINHGPQYTRNKGFSFAKGEYVIFCDADVIFKENALQKMLLALKEHPEVSYAYSSFIHGHKLFRLFEFSEEKIKEMPCIHSSSLVRREHLPERPWDENIKRLQDWDLWLTLLEQGRRGIWINDTLFRIQGGGHTMSFWLPSFAYKLFPFLPKVKKYNEAVRAVKEKHGLNNVKRIADNE